MPSCTLARTSSSAASITQLPAVCPVISSERTMSTPAPRRVARVREKRAIVIFMTTSPIFIGRRSFILSQNWRPCSVRFARTIP